MPVVCPESVPEKVKPVAARIKTIRKIDLIVLGFKGLIIELKMYKRLVLKHLYKMFVQWVVF
jgi:hypothetical protein